MTRAKNSTGDLSAVGDRLPSATVFYRHDDSTRNLNEKSQVLGHEQEPACSVSAPALTTCTIRAVETRKASAWLAKIRTVKHGRPCPEVSQGHIDE